MGSKDSNPPHSADALNLPRSSSPFAPPASGFATPSRFLALHSGSGFTPQLGPDGAAAPSSGVFTPGLLFSSSRAGASGQTPGSWWQGAAGKAEEINPFEETLSRQQHNSIAAPVATTTTETTSSSTASLLHPPTAHQAAIHALGHGRRATISTAAGDLWANLQSTGGLGSGYGGLDSWIDFSGGHPGTPGVMVAGHKRRSSEVDGDQPQGRTVFATHDARMAGAEAEEELPMSPKRTRHDDGRSPAGEEIHLLTGGMSAPFPTRSFTTSSSSAASPHLGPPTLTPHSSSADTTLTPPSALPTSAIPVSTGAASAAHDGKSANPPSSSYGNQPFPIPSRVSHPKPAPDPTQAVPQFVGVQHYAGQDAPPGARDVMAEFLQRMNQGGGVPMSAARQSQAAVQAASPTTSASPQNQDQSWAASLPTGMVSSSTLPAPVPGAVTAFLGGGMMGSVRAPPPKVSPVKDATALAKDAVANKARSVASVTSKASAGKGKGKAPVKAEESMRAASPTASESSRSAKSGGGSRIAGGSTSRPVPTKNMTSGSVGGGDAEEEKRKQFLERNRIAACKSRAKKKEWQEQLEARAQELSAHNNDLQALVAVMRDEIVSLRAMVAQHAACSCGTLKGFVEGGGLGVPTGFGAWGMGAAAPLGAATEYLARQQQQQAFAAQQAVGASPVPGTAHASQRVVSGGSQRRPSPTISVGSKASPAYAGTAVLAAAAAAVVNGEVGQSRSDSASPASGGEKGDEGYFTTRPNAVGGVVPGAGRA